MLASSELTIPQREWLDLELLVNGHDITIWVNGKQTAVYKIPARAGPLWSGRIGLQQNALAAVRLRWPVGPAEKQLRQPFDSIARRAGV